MRSDLERSAPGRLADELRNFTEIVRMLSPAPADTPQLDGIDIDGFSLPLYGTIGGDHIVYIDFKKLYDLEAMIAKATAAGREAVSARLNDAKHRAGILVADVAGHRITDALVAAMLHQAFLLGTQYELEMFGEITTNLFGHIKTRFYESTNIAKLVAMIYGEITEQGMFRYTSAGHVPPLVFSREFGRIMRLDADRTVSDALVGMFPGGRGPEPRRQVDPGRDLPRGIVAVNEIQLLGAGDILLLATDGVTDHAEGRFVVEELPGCLHRVKDESAAEICIAVRDALLTFGPPTDDASLVVVKKR